MGVLNDEFPSPIHRHVACLDAPVCAMDPEARACRVGVVPGDDAAPRGAVYWATRARKGRKMVEIEQSCHLGEFVVKCPKMTLPGRHV